MWLASSAAGQGIPTRIAGYYDRVSPPFYFGSTGITAIALGPLLLHFVPVIRRQMKVADVGDVAVHT